MTRPNFLAGRVLSWSRNQATTVAIVAMSLFVLATLWFGQMLWLYALAIAVCALMIFSYPAVGLSLILVCTMWFERHFTLRQLMLNETFYKIYPLDMVIFLTGIAIVIAWGQGRLAWRPSKFDIPIILFGIVVTLGYIYSFFNGQDPSAAFSTFKNYILYGIVYIYAVLLLTNRDEWRYMMRWFAIGGVGLFFFLFYGMYVGEGIWSEFTPLSSAGTRLIAGTHVFYMVLFSFWVLAMHLWKNSEEEEGDDPKFLFSILALIFVAIVVSLVRHLWIALAGLIVVWFLFLKKREQTKLLTITGYGIAFSLFLGIIGIWGYGLATGEFPSQLDKTGYILKQRVSIATVVELEDSSSSWRLAAWQGGLDLWQTSPIIGVGYGHQVEGIFGTSPFRVPMRELHNNYLGILIELGIIGFGVLTYWFLVLFKQMHQLWQRHEHLPLFEKRLLFTSLSWVLLFMAVFPISIYWNINLFIVWWWIALAAVRWLFTRET